MAVKQPKLRTRVFAGLAVLSILVFACTATALVAASWRVYERGAESELLEQTQTYAMQLAGKSNDSMIASCQAFSLVETRCTLIDAGGHVLFDNTINPKNLGNHNDREEVSTARSGRQVALLRRSNTIGIDTLYAAVLVDNSDNVLRLSKTRTSLPSYLANLAGPLAAIALLAVALSLLVARLLTAHIVKPLDNINPARPLEMDAYAEMQPLLERIDAQNLRLEQTVNMRREFTGNVSHEMKTPLQVIGGYAELIQEGVASPEDTRRFAGLIRSESESMRVLIDDVLTLSKLDEGATGNPLHFAFDSACKRAILRLENATQTRNIVLHVQLAHDIFVFGHEDLAEQMIYNLVDNAIRHGRVNGHIDITLNRENNEAVLCVADDGPGIPSEQRDRVFERFYRVDVSRSRETGGTGLGLAIVKHAVETMNGGVTIAESALGGAEFVVKVPLAPAPSTGKTGTNT